MGQILIPALLVLPSLFLFVFLIFETARLSREKIRHQFAVDAASFVEMTNYSDFFNRTAYINGAFPERIFAEAFLDGSKTCFQKKNAQANGGSQGNMGCGSGGEQAYGVLYNDGAFPGKADPTADISAGNGGGLDSQSSWKLEYTGPHAAEKQQTNPTGGFGMSQCVALTPPDYNCLDIFSRQNALDYWVDWDTAHHIFDLYVMVYQLLGSVEDAQQKVFQRLVGSHTFYAKSWWLNTGDAANGNGCGSEPCMFPTVFDPSMDVKAACVQELMFYGNQPKPDPYQPYIIYAPKQPVRGFTTDSMCGGNGLFQVEYIANQGNFLALSAPHTNGTAATAGLPIQQKWDVQGGNFFGVNMNSAVDDGCGGGGSPCVHATIATLQNSVFGQMGGAVWPDPTPKFQTELFP